MNARSSVPRWPGWPVIAAAIAALPLAAGHASPVFTIKRSFSTGAQGARAYTTPIQAPDGNLYGTTPAGGAYGFGTVYRLTLSGKLTVLYNFTGGPIDGRNPSSALTLAPTGEMWGTTSGDPSTAPTIYHINAAGAFTLAHTLSKIEGIEPAGDLFLASDGNFYGANWRGGTGDYGVVYRVTPTGHFSIVHDFTALSGDGGDPQSGVVQASDGDLYGTTEDGGLYGAGAIYRLKLDGAYATIYSFDPAAGALDNPRGRLTEASDGNLYGVADGGGVAGSGGVYRVSTTGQFTDLHEFVGGVTDGAYSGATLVQLSDGRIYGTSTEGGVANQGTVFRVTMAGAYGVFASLTAPDVEGPVSGVLAASDGNLYLSTPDPSGVNLGAITRVTRTGGVATLYTWPATGATLRRGGLTLARDGSFWIGANVSPVEWNNILRITPNGTATAIATFPAVVDLNALQDTLTEGPDGNMYGVSSDGGANGKGAVYRVTPTGVMSIVHSFSGPDGARPHGYLTVGGDGWLYGATITGTGCDDVLYKVSTIGAFAVIKTFLRDSSNYVPPMVNLPLTLGPDGNIYGTTQFGASESDSLAFTAGGSLFRITMDGTFTYVKDFFRYTDFIENPCSALAVGSDGALYGCAFNRGGFVTGQVSQGALYRITTDGLLSVLYYMNAADGPVFHSAPTLGSDGNFYYASDQLGYGAGAAIMRFTPSGVLRRVYDVSMPNGAHPVGSLTQARDGTLWGATFDDGDTPGGMVYQLDLGLPSATTAPAPMGVSATSTPSTITLTWSQSQGATGYAIYRGTVSGGETAFAGPIATSTFVDTSVSLGTTYFYKLRALRTVGVSPLSAEVSAVAEITQPVVLQDPANAITLWSMNGYLQTGQAQVTPPPPAAWRVVGEADFTGDQIADIVLENSTTRQILVYKMNGTTVTKGIAIQSLPPAGSHVVSVADFNGDGKPDIAIENMATRQITIWVMNGVTRTTAAVVTTPPAGWTVCGAGDFDGDGRADLVLQNVTADRLVVWTMNGATVSGSFALPYVTVGSSVVAIGDFNSDGLPDLLLDDPTTHILTMWFMRGKTRLSQRTVLASRNFNQLVVAPH